MRRSIYYYCNKQQNNKTNKQKNEAHTVFFMGSGIKHDDATIAAYTRFAIPPHSRSNYISRARDILH